MRQQFGSLVLVGVACSCASPPTESRPEIVLLITVDTLRADRLGVYGYKRPTSPEIDAFASEAVVVRNAIAAAPYTKASIASLMTGLYPTAHKAYTTSATVADAMDGDVQAALPHTDVLPEQVLTLAEALKEAGYQTAALTTNPFLLEDFGFGQGFDRFEFLAEDGFAPATEVLARARAVVEARSGPLFLWVHLMEPHSPYEPPEQFRKLLPPLRPARPIPASVDIPPWIQVDGSRDLRLYESLYDAEVRTVDAALGEFLDDLRRREVWARTAVVLTADHGEQFLEHGGLEHSTGLYDELIRVPLIVRVPGLKPGFVDGPAQLVDVMPMLLRLARSDAAPSMNGRDLMPLLRGEETAQPAYSEIPGHQYAIRTNEWKLIAGPEDEREMYHLAGDPGEQFDRAADEGTPLPQLERTLGTALRSAMQIGRDVTGTVAPVSPAVLERLGALGYLR